MNKNKESLHLSSPAINTHMNKRSQIWAAFRSAFPYTIPILQGFIFGDSLWDLYAFFGI